MSPLNDDADRNMECMLVDPMNLPHILSLAAETSQDPNGPCGPSEQSLDSFRHSLMAASSLALDLGVQTVVGVLLHGYMVAVRVSG